MEVPAYPTTFWELLARRAEQDPDRVLIEDDQDRSLTAAQWLQRSEQVAAGLHHQGVGEDTVVSWQLPTTIEAVILLSALARLGAIQNPIIPLLRRREVGFIVGQTKSRLLITPQRWRNFDYGAMAADIAAEYGIDTLTLAGQGLPSADPGTLPPPPSGTGEPVRHIYYSSGSTADPKGARHTDRSVMYAATGTILGYDVQPEDCIPVPFPYTHIGGIALTVASLYTRCRLLFIEIFDPKNSPLVIGRKGGTLLGSAVPFFHAYLEAQKQHGPEPLYPRLKAFSGGGAPKPPELYYEMKERFGVGIVSSWGLTEFPIATAGTLDDSDEELAHTEGRAVPGVQVRVVGNDERDVPAGQEGELRLKGPQACQGYVDSSLDAGAFDDQGFFRTGDLGFVGRRGHVQITGRIKDVIIRNAENISAQEVEDVLYTHPKVADVAVVGIPDPVTGERACAVVVLAEGAGSLSLTELADFCRQQKLANQKIPERLEIVDQLPRNALGKILKRELRSTYGVT
ncbi:MAG TPA: AMP-binding protein [Acidimicrobiales bacterium]|nr:AMP-binding protein [Acidimicrobiales bacterium]